MAKFHIFRSFIFPPTPVFPTIFPPERENKSQTGRKKHAHFFFFAAWRKKNRMHVRHFFRQFSSFGPISWPIAGKLVFSLRCNKQYVRLGQCCWFFSLFFWHSESGFALPSCQKNRENKTANIALGAQLLYCNLTVPEETIWQQKVAERMLDEGSIAYFQEEEELYNL